MPNGQPGEWQPPDLETLLLIGAVGAVFGALTAVGTFLLYDWAERAGPRLRTPNPLQPLYDSVVGAVEPFQPESLFPANGRSTR